MGVKCNLPSRITTVFAPIHQFSNQTRKHKDLTKSRILKDEETVSSSKTILTETFINPFLENELVCISNGVLSSEKLKNDLLNAENLDNEALDIFISTRWDENGEAVDNNFFKPIKKLKLQTFPNLKSNVSIKLKDREISLNSQMNLFGQLAIIMQTRQINLKDVFVIH